MKMALQNFFPSCGKHTELRYKDSSPKGKNRALNLQCLTHPAGRALISDLFVNSFIMVVYEKFLVVLWTENSDGTSKNNSRRHPL